MTNSKKWDVVVVGGANTDFLVQGSALPKPGETIDGETFQTAPGGKGANQAVAAARLGARVAFVGRLGTEERGDEIMDILRREGIDTRYVSRDRNAPTGVALIMVDKAGEKQIMTAPGANHRLRERHVQRAATVIRRARVVLMQFEVPSKTVLKAARLAREAGAKVVLDPAPPRRTSRELLALIDLIRPNASEAEALTRINATNRTSARRAAQKLFVAGARAAALQAGTGGNLLVWQAGDGGECWIPKMRVKTVDATGAGDAFIAALAVALAEGQSFEIAGVFASAAAALATTKVGAQAGLPFRQEVFALMRRLGLAKEAAAFAKRR
jgi:ribokinase